MQKAHTHTSDFVVVENESFKYDSLQTGKKTVFLSIFCLFVWISVIENSKYFYIDFVKEKVLKSF